MMLDPVTERLHLGEMYQMKFTEELTSRPLYTLIPHYIYAVI